MIATQVLYHLSHSASPFCVGYFLTCPKLKAWDRKVGNSRMWLLGGRSLYNDSGAIMQ
jgi:hypothetical protein